MAKGVIYIMTSVVPGLIKIGKTDDFKNRMNYLERHGYRNVTGLRREFAIEVEDYAEKEIMLQTIFAKSRLAETEMFALDKNIVIQLLSSFDGTIIFPESENKSEIFEKVTENIDSKLIPNGEYHFRKKKQSDNKTVHATVKIENGCWTLKKGSVLGITEDAGVSQKAKLSRAMMLLDENGKLLEDFNLGPCTPSHAGTVVMNQSINGWTDWKNEAGESLDVYKKRDEK